jgi:Zn-dependent protease
MNGDSTPTKPDASDVYRCNRCGIESKEPSCFVGVARKGPQRFAVTCITCIRDAKTDTSPRAVFGAALLICLPAFLVTARRPEWNDQLAFLILAGCVTLPLLIFLHELGHFSTAKLLGLTSSLITIGVGKTLWSGRLFGVPFRIHAWPLSGRTYLISDTLRWFRLRLWLTTLMGPATHLVLIVLTLKLWDSLTQFVAPHYLATWILQNVFLFLGNVIPHRSRTMGNLNNDGLQLLTIPFSSTPDLAIYQSSTALIAAIALCNDGNYAAARNVCIEALKRHPTNESFLVLLSGCQINLADYEAAQHTLQKAGDLSQIRAMARAAMMNNIALSEWLRDPAAPLHSPTMARADALPEEAYQMYPCFLAYRSTRALILTATNRAHDALTLLEYPNYERGSNVDRADCEGARAYAFQKLGKNDESRRAIAKALQLSKTVIPYFNTIGLIPATNQP